VKLNRTRIILFFLCSKYLIKITILSECSALKSLKKSVIRTDSGKRLICLNMEIGPISISPVSVGKPTLQMHSSPLLFPGAFKLFHLDSYYEKTWINIKSGRRIKLTTADKKREGSIDDDAQKRNAIRCK
jgi:hypothetical protein